MKAIVAAALAIGLGAPAYAQDSLAGAYRGSIDIKTAAGPFNVGVTLVIAQVDGGKVSGTGTFHTGPCAGDYPLVGKTREGAIGVISTKKGGAAGDCTFGFKGNLEGNQLVGSMGPYQVTLRK